jgi:predicted dinucleotide-binding enzyme
MKVAIIGTGNVGSAIARGLKGKKHEVVLGSPGRYRAPAVANTKMKRMARANYLQIRPLFGSEQVLAGFRFEPSTMRSSA